MTATLPDLLALQAERHGPRIAYRFLEDGERESRTVTYSELRRAALQIATRLAQLGIGSGSRVLLLAPTGPAFTAGFWGSLIAGAIVSTINPPLRPRHLDRTEAIVADFDPELVVSTEETMARLDRLSTTSSLVTHLPRLYATMEGQGGAESEITLSPDAPAIVQYTSGSTSEPKGVELTHAQVLANEKAIRSTFGHDDRTVVVGWLPLFHDMGLIGNLIQPIYCGGSCVLLEPIHFMQRPELWLKAISDYRATTSGGPNFAYDLCAGQEVKTFPTGLDLSSWRVAFNGAEPVNADTLDRFAQKFAPAGFKRTAFTPCYGLAEATLLVSAKPRRTTPRVIAACRSSLRSGRLEAVRKDGQRFVSCGRPPNGTRITIRRGDTAVPDGEIGEIHVQGPAIASGYWQRPNETAEAFLHADSLSTLKTGDLGCLLDGELYVTGRKKDMLVIRGRNIYPNDLETAAKSAHPALSAGMAAAFAVDQRPALVIETRRGTESLTKVAQAAATAILDTAEIVPAAVLLVRPASLPRTSSGKIQRSLTRERYLAGEFEKNKLYEWAPGEAFTDEPLLDPAHGELQSSVAEVLGVPISTIDLDRPAIELGLDSLRVFQLSFLLEQKYGRTVDSTTLLSAKTLREGLTHESGEDRSTKVVSPSRPPTASSFPLSPEQEAVWIDSLRDPSGSGYTLYGAVDIQGTLTQRTLHDAVVAVAALHPVLRLALTASTPPRQYIRFDATVTVEIHDMTWAGASELDAALRYTAERGFDLVNGPLFRVHLFRRGGDAATLLLAAHHIAADFETFGLITHDLLHSLAGMPTHEAIDAARYAACIEERHNALNGESAERARAFWRSWADTLPRPKPTTIADADAQSTEFRCGSLAFEFNSELTERLRRFELEQEITRFTGLAAAYALTLHALTERSWILIGSPVSTRTSALFAGVSGCFTQVLPLAVRVDSGVPIDQLCMDMRRVVNNILSVRALPCSEALRAMPASTRLALRQPVRSLVTYQSFQDPTVRNLSALCMGVPGAEATIGELNVYSRPFHMVSASYDLALQFAEGPQTLSGWLQYRTSRVDTATAIDFGDRFQVYLEQLTRPGDERLPRGGNRSLPNDSESYNQPNDVKPRNRFVFES